MKGKATQDSIALPLLPAFEWGCDGDRGIWAAVCAHEEMNIGTRLVLFGLLGLLPPTWGYYLQRLLEAEIILSSQLGRSSLSRGHLAMIQTSLVFTTGICWTEVRGDAKHPKHTGQAT